MAKQKEETVVVETVEEVLGQEEVDTDTFEDSGEAVFEENFDDVFEESLLPNGEHEMHIIKLSIEKSKKTEGRKMLHVILESTQYDTAREVHDYMLFENPALGDTKKAINRRKLRRINFYKAFGIDPSAGISCAEATGLTGYAIISTQDDKQYGKQNRVKDYSTGE